MEDEGFTCRHFIHSPKPTPCFQADRFIKINNLNIPDTITEQPSVEISGNSPKMEALKTEANGDENVTCNLSEKSSNSSVSTIIALDNSYVVDCERKLLESSNSNEDKYFVASNKKIDNGFFSEVTRKLGLHNVTVSTPPHILRNQINMLRTEMAEADEFHDLEMVILKEEKNLKEEDGLPYAQLIEKYTTLMDLYTTLKNEYDEYRKQQEKLQSETADCFESLCSQIQASDSSLNLSCASFVSFGADIKSSTMMGNMSEVEATFVNDASVLEHDPLAITQDEVFKTSKHFPLRSVNKLLAQCEEKIEITEGRETEKKLLYTETALQGKIKEVEELTEKLKTEIIGLNPSLEDSLVNATGTKLLSIFIQTIMESCKGVQDDLIKKFNEEKLKWEVQKQEAAAVEIENLQEEVQGLSKKTEDLRSRVMETENLIATMQLREDCLRKEKDATVFELETRLSCAESSKSEMETKNSDLEKICEELKVQVTVAEKAVSACEDEIRRLTTSEQECKLQLTEAEAQKTALGCRCRELEEGNTALRTSRDVLLRKIEEVELEKENLMNRVQQTEKIVMNLEIELKSAKEDRCSMEELVNEMEKLGGSYWWHEKEPENKNSSDRIFDLPMKTVLGEKLVTVFTAAVVEKTKEVEEESRREKSEWEVQHNLDLNLIESLRDQIKRLELTLSEMKAESKESKQEIDLLISRDVGLKEDLAVADETILRLKYQLSVVESEKSEVETRCRELEDGKVSLASQILTKEKRLEEVQEVERELKEQLLGAEELIAGLKLAAEEQNSRVAALRREIDSLRKENEDLGSLADRVKVLEEKKENLTGVLADLQSCLDVSTDFTSKLVSGKYENRKILSEGINAFVKSQTEDLKIENQNLKLGNENLKEKRRELENENAELRTSQDVLLRKIEEVELEKENLMNRVQQTEKIVMNLEIELKSAKEDRCSMEELVNEMEKLGGSYWWHEKEPENKNSSDRIFDLPMKTVLGEKLVTVFTAAVVEKTKEVEEESRREKSEWEVQHNLDLNLIESLRDQIKRLELTLSEMKAESKESKQEIDLLISRDVGLKEDLAVADKTILRLKYQLSVVESEKSEVETRCRELEDGKASLASQILTKEKRLEEVQEVERELKEQLLGAEELIAGLKLAAEEQNSRVAALRREIDSLRKENEDLGSLADRVKVLEEKKENLTGVLADLQSCLDVSTDFTSKLISGKYENRKILSEGINAFVKSQTEDLKIENQNLKLGNEHLIEKVRELSNLVGESVKTSLVPARTSRTKSGKSSDLCVRRLDKLEEMNHNLTDLINRILALTGFPDLEKLKLCSVQDFANVAKQVLTHFNKLESEMEELRAGNANLDEECDSYAKTIKDLKRDAVAVWRSNKEKTEALEDQISRLKKEKAAAENERQNLLSSISKLDAECQKLKAGSASEGSLHTCACGNELKKMKDMKRTLLIKEQKILELQDLEAQNALYKSQIKYLENALEQEKKKVSEEKEKTKKHQSELRALTKDGEKAEKSGEEKVLEELRMCGSLSGGVVQEFVDKEKMRKLAKDIGILKELCRARYAEIKRLEAENVALRKAVPKNSNQMDSPIRSRVFSAKKVLVSNAWKREVDGKENGAL